MKLVFMPQAEFDIAYWNRNDKAKTQRIRALLESVMDTPFEGIGKPEPLKYDLSGCWSRRIDLEHRIVYTVEEGAVYVISCRFHYKK